MADYEISAKFDHDASKLGEYYRKLEEEYLANTNVWIH